jgi:hypothetical protein
VRRHGELHHQPAPRGAGLPLPPVQPVARLDDVPNQRLRALEAVPFAWLA